MEKKEFIAALNGTIKELIDLLDSVSQKKINQIPFEGSWTAGQVGDHLRRSYGLFETIRGTVQATTRPADENFSRIGDIFLNFETKLKAPDFIIPSADPIDKKELIDSISLRLEEIIRFMNENDLTLTCLDFELPGSGPLTRLEWFHLMYCHTQRHNRQLKRIIDKVNIE